jgi:hypothetical protein
MNSSSSSPFLKHLKSPLIRSGLPLVAFCTLGYVLLGHFVNNKVSIVDANRRQGSERALQLEIAHTAIVKRLAVGEEYDVKPIPRPKDD